MITTCEKCETKHKLNMAAVTGKVAKFKCRKCEHINRVTNPEYMDTPEDTFQQEAPLKQSMADTLAIKPKISGLSIKSKITLVIVALIISSLSIVGYIASDRGSKALSKQAADNLILVSGLKAQEYNSIFNRLQDEIEGVAIFAAQTYERDNISEDLSFALLMPWTGKSHGNPQLNQKLHPEALKLQRIGRSLKGLIQKNPYLELGYMGSETNIFVADDEKVVGIIGARQGFVPKKRPWYIDAVDKGKTIWTQPYVDANTEKLIVSCATPVFNKDKSVLGVIGFDVLLDTIQKDIISLDIGYNSRAFLLGKKGNLLAQPKGKNIAWNQSVKTENALETNNEEFKTIIKQMMVGARGIGTHTEDGNEIIVSYAPVPAIDASVGIVVAQQEVMKPAKAIQKLIVSVWVVVVIISIFIGLMIGNGITKPINNLTMRAELISQGKTDLEEIANKRKDEIGVLIESFNRLVVSLKMAMSRKRR